MLLRDHEPDGGAAGGIVAGEDGAARARDDVVDDGQPEPRSGKLPRGI
jgi:hypothetical protein